MECQRSQTAGDAPSFLTPNVIPAESGIQRGGRVVRFPSLAGEMSEGQRGHHVIPAKAGIHVGATLVVAPPLSLPLSEGEFNRVPAIRNAQDARRRGSNQLVNSDILPQSVRSNDYYTLLTRSAVANKTT